MALCSICSAKLQPAGGVVGVGQLSQEFNCAHSGAYV